MASLDKLIIYARFEVLASIRIRLIQESLDDLKEAGRNETKSTAGDKHETALAMIQLEQEKKRNQLRAATQLLAEFRKIDPLKTGPAVGRGSLVNTNRGWFFLSQALGKIDLDGQTVISLSPQSPLGLQLIGRVAGDQFIINNSNYSIEFVC